MFLEIDLKFRYHVALNAGYGIGSHGFDGVARCNDAVYDRLRHLKRGIAKDEQMREGL